MGIYGQPNSWQCGPFALKHGLLALGVFTHEEDLTRLAGSTEDGTDESQLERAARRFGCNLPLVRRRTPDAARRALAAELERGRPVLLCVDQWEHWITAVALHGQDVVVFDSHFATPLRVEPWARLEQRLGYHQRRWRGLWERTMYDLHPLVPRRGRRFRLSLPCEAVAYLLRPENALLIQKLDDVARGLLELAVQPGPQLELGFGLDAFLAMRREAIAELALGTQPGAAPQDVQRGVDWLIFVARLYAISLKPELEPHAVARAAGVLGDLIVAEAPEAAASAQLVA